MAAGNGGDMPGRQQTSRYVLKHIAKRGRDRLLQGASRRAILWAAPWLLLPCLISASAGAASGPILPNSGSFAAGAGSIAAGAGSVTVTQSSQRAVINWNSFSIGQGGVVQFQNGAGATLNRVTGGDHSTILGTLKATGTLYLINPNGVVIGSSGVVVTGGFVASTLNLANSAFMAGGTLVFKGDSTASITNLGAISSTGGDVLLIARNVSNAGTLNARQGAVALAAGQEVLVQDSGDEHVFVRAAGGNVTNTGAIAAAQAELAASGGNVYALAGNTGIIRATGTATRDGQVWLTADGGDVEVSGAVIAQNADGSGGTITAKGQSLTLRSGAVLNAAGKTGHGKVETSGQSVSVGGATVTAGVGGTWLVDPTDLTIDAAAAGTISGSLNAGTSVTEQTTATTASGAGNQASGLGDINVDSAISWNTAATLTLSAFNNVNVNAAITASGPGMVAIVYGNNLGGTSSASAALNFAPSSAPTPGGIQFTGAGGALSINAISYTLINSMAALQNIGLTGDYALATNLNATGVTGFTPIGVDTPFTGIFNGLGNAISNLAITSAAGNVGLFGQVGAAGVITSVGLVGASITATSTASAGLLAGVNQGAIANSYATGFVSAPADSVVGGLVGNNQGSIASSYAAVAASVGSNSSIGGLAGQSEGLIANSYATGSASTSGGFDDIGGLVGYNQGSIATSFATASASDRGGFSAIGGLVGDNTTSGNISNSYAAGAATESAKGSNIGGFAGSNEGSITSSYATGQASGGGLIGGFVGNNSGAQASLTSVYWDTSTNLATTTGVGNGPGTAGGLTTSALEAVLPSGFSSSVWGHSNTETAPYLLSNIGPVYAGNLLSTLIFTIPELEAMNNNLAGNYSWRRISTGLVTPGSRRSAAGSGRDPSPVR
jgi:filamentous hemagglutinin family protein